ncbi:uncharacterized protein LOC121785363 isoform X2 [Salvia splendens]|uniref:uncharacterized protein LOC121785363 isoform X2 n=1 Tax=Salvia splendens TaxID=180675 RepID=UPI001C263733|nr:uncharacterized protein LOC121785363 isoform X2 [Salvia splendens]
MDAGADRSGERRMKGVWEKRYERCLICVTPEFATVNSPAPPKTPIAGSTLAPMTRSLTSEKTTSSPMNGSSCLTAAAAAPDFAESRGLLPDPLRVVGSCSSAESRREKVLADIEFGKTS